MSFDSHCLDPGSLGPKHRVWWLFLPLLCYNLLPTAQGSICETIISKGGLQALTPCGSTLYLAVDNQLYSIPLSDAYLVASPVNGGGGIALYDRTPESAPGYRALGKWTDVAWLKPALGKPEEPPKTLVTIHIFPKPVVYVHLAFEYEQDKVKKPGFRLVNNGTGQVEVPTETFEPFLGMLTDGDGSGYLVSKEGEDIVVKANPSIDKDKKIPTSGNKYHPYLTDAGTVGFNATKPSGAAKPLLTGAQVHGFKYQGYFHYWDLANKRVLVFKDPVGGGAAQKYATVPLEKYLVCANWAQAISGGGGGNGTQNGTVVTGGEGGGGGMGFITKAFLWLLVLVGLGTGGYYGFQYAKSKGLLKRWIKSVAKPKSKTKSKGPSSVKNKSSTPSKTGSAKPGSAKSGTSKSSAKASTSSGTQINPTPPGKSAVGYGTGSKTPTTPTSKSGSKTPSTPTSSSAMTPQAPPTSGVGYFGSSRAPTSVSTSGSTPVGQSNVASSNIVTSVTGPASAAAPPKVVGVTLKKDVASQASSTTAAPTRVVSVTSKKDVATSPVSSPAPPRVVGAVLKKDIASQASGVGSSTTAGSTSAAPPSSKIGTISPGPSNLSQVKPPSNPLMGRSTIQPTPSTRAPARPPPAMLYPPASRAPIPIVPSTTRATTPATSNASSNIAQANSSSSTSPASSTSSSAGGASSTTPTSSTGGPSKGGPSSNV